jgi:hypothetical protein
MPKIILIGKRRYLAGMQWHTFVEKPTKASLRKDVEDENSGLMPGTDWIAIRPASDDLVQSGFCRRPEGLKIPGRLYSLAAAIAAVRKQPWLGVFKIDENTWWYIAVRDGNTILPDGDVIGDEETVRAALNNHAGYEDWTHVEGDFETLKDIVAESSESKIAITPLYGMPISPQVLAVAAASIIVAGGLSTWWFMHESAKKRAIQMQSMQSAVKKLAAIPKKKVPVMPPSPLIGMLMPDDWLSNCVTATKNIPLSSRGWSFSKLSCSEKALFVTWHREDGALSSYAPDGALSATGDEVNTTIPLKITQPGVDDRVTLEEEKRMLVDFAQRTGLTLSLATTDTSVKTAMLDLPGQKKVETEPDFLPQLPSAQFSLILPFTPLKIALNRIPGLRLTVAEFDGAQWKLTGVLYGK